MAKRRWIFQLSYFVVIVYGFASLNNLKGKHGEVERMIEDEETNASDGEAAVDAEAVVGSVDNTQQWNRWDAIHLITSKIRWFCDYDRFKLNFEPINLFGALPLNDRLRSSFFGALKRANPANNFEGHTGLYPEKIETLQFLANATSIKTICETGFNFGHSALNFLSSNSEATVYSFDLGAHEYSRPMARFLNKTFPGRLTVIFGNSTETVPSFVGRNRGSLRCDLILIDGGHDYSTSRSDLESLISLASPNRTLIIFDDHPTSWSNEFGKSWEETCRSGRVKELLRCRRRTNPRVDRGFVFGTVVL